MDQFLKGDDLQISSHEHWKSLTTGCIKFDELLGGGVLTKGITELSGQSGCGKTQLCLQLAITVQYPKSLGGLDAGAVFICTEDKFPSVRLNQMINSCLAIQKFPNINFGDNIFIVHVADTAELLKCVNEQLPQIIQKRRIGLIVVDSVAAVFRADYSCAESLQRARDLRAFGCQLHKLVATHRNMAAVCVNQVTDIRRGNQSLTVPALGLAWANLVTCRLQMFRQDSNRYLHVIFAPHLPRRFCQYVINTQGVAGVGQPINSS